MTSGRIIEIPDHMVQSMLEGGKPREETPRPLPEAQIMMLRELYEAYHTQQFAPGDIVTPRAGTGINGAGNPTIVLEVRDDAELDFSTNRPGPFFGRRLEMRVMTLMDEDYLTFWTEMWPYVMYDKG